VATLDVHHRQALAIAIALVAPVTLIARYYMGRHVDITRRALQPSEQNRAADRYTKAIEQLGSKELDIRLGGIYDLERIARDSAREHPMVMEVLAAFIRERSLDPDVDEAEHGEAEPRNRRLRADVQAAIAVIGRRIISHDLPGMRIDLTKADLTEVTLTGAQLAGATLTGANLAGATLTGATLTEANLLNANLAGATLADANLTRANLTNANLVSAYLALANLTDANLTGANLIGTVGLSGVIQSAPGGETGVGIRETS
jgi:hypothetical protein